MTGLAGGDHLHFTMLVNGQMVNPVEWWDAHWIEDRILRKLQDDRGHVGHRSRATSRGSRIFYGTRITRILCFVLRVAV